MAFRICLGVALLFSILFLPFWVSVLLGLFGVIYFAYFFEVVVLFLLSDLLYGVVEVRYFEITFVSALLALVAVILTELLKSKLKFDSGFKGEKFGMFN